MIVCIELTTGTSTTDTSIGLVDGVFRFVTGDTDKAPGDLTNEDGSPNAYTWYSGFLVDKGLGSPSRQIDIRRTGTYGKVSGFSFKLRNDSKFWVQLQSHDIYLVNRGVQVYAAIGAHMSAIWAGVVSNNPYADVTYTVNCRDNSQAVHREFPPNTFGRNKYEDIDEREEGETVPVCAGEVARAQVHSVVKNADKKLLFINQTTLTFMYKAAAVKWETGTAEPYGDVTEIWLYTPGAVWPTDTFKGKYLYIRNGSLAGTFAEIVVSEPFTSYLFPGADLTAVAVKGIFTSEPAWVYDIAAGANGDTVFFEIVDYAAEVVFSNRPVHGYNAKAGGAVPLLYYNQDANTYENISAAVEGVRVDDRDYIQILSTSGEGGTVITQARLDADADDTRLSDVDRTTGPAAGFASSSAVDKDLVSAELYVSNIDFTAYESVYIAPDVFLDTNGVAGQVITTVSYEDIYGREVLLEDPHTTYPSTPSALNQDVNQLPNNFYVGGDDNGEASLSDTSSELRESTKVSDGTKTLLDNGAISKLTVRVYYHNTTSTPTDIDYKVKQIGLFSDIEYSPQDVEGMYTSVQGEPLTDGSKSDNVYTLFRLLLEEYDQISAADIDYTNLASLRTNWKVGRQFTERKNNRDNIEQLARSAFVGVCPDRLGRRRLRCWLEDTDFSALSHSDGSIVRGSIKNFNETPPDFLYNDFSIRYNYDPGAEDYTRGLLLTRAWKESFPAADGVDADGLGWESYFSGLGPTDYADAKLLWEALRAAYLRTNASNKAPQNISEFPFFIDRSGYDPAIDEGTLSSAFRALSLMVSWLSAPKNEVTYSIPFTTAALRAVELLEPVTFTDVILTNDQARTGWITKIQYDLERAEIGITALLKNPDSAEFSVEDIEETGSAADLIDETGSAADLIDETGV